MSNGQMTLFLVIVLPLAVGFLPLVAPDYPQSAVPVSAMDEQRYCGAPARNLDATIRRSSAVRAAFQRLHPCPLTGQTTGACAGWQVDHVIPLAVGGCDAVSNMQWLPTAIKTCPAASGLPCKDRWERDVYRHVQR